MKTAIELLKDRTERIAMLNVVSALPKRGPKNPRRPMSRATKRLVLGSIAFAIMIGGSAVAISDATAATSSSADVAGIVTPSGNIRCKSYVAEGLICQVINRGRSVVVPSSGKAYTRPLGRVITPHLYVLNYGESITWDGGICRSSFDGLECRGHGHGFFANRDRITTW
jgi:hypothetical protein